MKKISILILASIALISCNKNNEKADGYGNFEATEITVSSEANGKIDFLKVEEGDELKSNSQVGLVDTLQLHFAKQQLIGQHLIEKNYQTSHDKSQACITKSTQIQI